MKDARGVAGDVVKISKQLQDWADRATSDIEAKARAGQVVETLRMVRNMLEAAISRGIVAEREEKGPIPMRLRCPQCNTLHIDEGEFATRPHKTHTCQSCGEHFQPALVPTVGVKFLPGCESEKSISGQTRAQCCSCIEGVAYVSGGYCGRCGKPPFHAKIVGGKST